jgi:hypothetical protein
VALREPDVRLASDGKRRLSPPAWRAPGDAPDRTP